tara:strand:+ start:56 stop:706 length:651 start_codon:yes stop_codon:yes gene_type:complete
MAFKMKGSPAKMGTISGTAGHSSALKAGLWSKFKSSVTSDDDDKKETSTSDPYAEAKKKDPNLDKYISIQQKNEPGSEIYEANQAKINKAYGKTRDTKLKAAQIKNVEKKKSKTTTPKKGNILSNIKKALKIKDTKGKVIVGKERLKKQKEQTDKFRIGSSPAKKSGSEAHNKKFGGPNHKSHNWSENVSMQKKTGGIQPGSGKRKVLIPTTPKKK